MIQEFEISFEIYDQEKILQAIGDFSDVTKIQLTGSMLSFSWESTQEIQEMFYEFMNYVLSL